ncbi:MAG TPA: glycosyltransferase family 2 protein [Bryocella sp.]|nr:glycosyltransferase family 2 protein [Bryocella sp.]
MISPAWRLAAEYGEWLLAVLWLWRTNEAIRRVGEVPDISQPEWDLIPPEGAAPSLTVVVPARNEAENIGATLQTLVAQQYSSLRVLAIDDRSTDKTRQIVDEFAARYPDQIGAIHIDYLPEGWLGKTFALEVGTRNSSSEYLLFTDGDVLFSPSSLRRAMAYAATTQADHVVVLPTPEVRGRGEGLMLSFFGVLGMWITRPWRVSDPQARHDVIGVGAFNLVRRGAFEVLGGWEPQRLAVVEDVTLGRRMKAAGMRQRVAFGPELILVHWAKGARGIVRGLTKNLFASVNFRASLLLIGCAAIVILFLAPLAGLAWLRTMLPALMSVCCIGASYRIMSERSRVDARYGWLYPAAVFVMAWAMLRSMVSVWARRGVMWRGTYYPLRELRLHNSPLQWERSATQARRAEEKGRERVGARLLALWPALRKKDRKKER